MLNRLTASLDFHGQALTLRYRQVEHAFRFGVFHADLHPGNLMIFKKPKTGEISVGFIDLGMVGRFTRDMRKSLFYYFYSLVTGDPESAARYLTALTIPLIEAVFPVRYTGMLPSSFSGYS